MTWFGARAAADAPRDMLSDCRLMLRFARKNGLDMTALLRAHIAQLDALLVGLGMTPLTDIDARIVETPLGAVRMPQDRRVPMPDATPVAEPAAPADAPDALIAAPEAAADIVIAEMPKTTSELILLMHQELSKVIAPATALSLFTSEPPPGRHSYLGGLPLLVRTAAIAATLSALGFAVSAAVIAASTPNAAQRTAAANIAEAGVNVQVALASASVAAPARRTPAAATSANNARAGAAASTASASPAPVSALSPLPPSSAASPVSPAPTSASVPTPSPPDADAAAKPAADPGKLWTPDLQLQLWLSFNALASAALGASFYVLLRSQPFLVNRSFDPKYNAVYISRFITGLVGGLILAVAIGPMVVDKSSAGWNLTPGVLALLGGYSAEAVEQVLQRLVDVMLALFRGDNGANTQAKLKAEQVGRNAKILHLLPAINANRGDPVQLEATLQQIRDALKAPPS